MAKKSAPSLLGMPTELADGKSVKVSLYLHKEEWEILQRIARVIAPGIDPGCSKVVRHAIQEAGKLKRFQ
jgi:hypothetical protein